MFTQTHVQVFSFITNQDGIYRKQNGQACVCVCSSGQHLCLIALGGFICFREWQTDVSTSSYQRKDSSIGNNVPGQSQSDVFIGPAGKTNNRTVSKSHSETQIHCQNTQNKHCSYCPLKQVLKSYIRCETLTFFVVVCPPSLLTFV